MTIKPVNESGFATLIASIFLAIMVTVASGFVIYTLNNVRTARAAVDITSARYAADAGLEKGMWKLNEDPTYAGEVATSYNGAEFTIEINNLTTNTKRVVSTAYVPSAANPRITRTVHAEVVIDNSHIFFNYGVQAGNGGFDIGNNSIIEGNVYSNGPITGAGGSQVRGEAYSAGPNGLIDNILVTGEAHANRLNNCNVKDAFYQTITGCTVSGASNPNSADPDPQDFPIGDAQIEAWKAEAESGGVISGDVFISGTTGTLGPRKIVGNLTVEGGATLTMTGKLWVTGNVILNNNSVIKLHSSYGAESEMFVVDGIITMSNNVILQGAGTGSNILLVSESSSINSAAPAIQISNNADIGVFYARKGLIVVNNNASLKEITAYRIQLNNNIVLRYESGLANLNFKSGPGASWVFKKGTYIAD